LLSALPLQSGGYCPVLIRLTKPNQNQENNKNKSNTENPDSSKCNKTDPILAFFPEKHNKFFQVLEPRHI
jgi:hypothetical protein